MAQVRITDGIRSYVRDRFTNLYTSRISVKSKEIDDLGIGMDCYEHYIPFRERDLAHQLNADPNGAWLDVITIVNVEITYMRPDGSINTRRLQIPFRPPSPLPQRMRSYGYTFKLTEDMKTYEATKAKCLELDSIIAERDELIKQIVDNVLTKCTTLKQVLELWPTALDFMPEDVRERHNRKVEKRTLSALDVSIDEQTKISLLKARMLDQGK